MSYGDIHVHKALGKKSDLFLDNWKPEKTIAKWLTCCKLHTTSVYAQSWKPSWNLSTVQSVKDDTTVCGKPQDTNRRHEHYETIPWLITAG